jgi:hypothetical protein
VDKQTETELEAAAFRSLLSHLQNHPDVQNIELMILADFCRNCLAKWYAEAAKQREVDIDYEQARDKVYGMPYAEWKERYQLVATPEQMAAYEKRQKEKH